MRPSPEYDQLSYVTIVPGHAPFKGTTTSEHLSASNLTQDEFWCLQPFQTGEPRYYTEHIQAGVSHVDECGLLVFSGGQTRFPCCGDWTEADTYATAARIMNGDKLPAHVEDRDATTSLENVLCGLGHFMAITRRTPERINVMGWKFKADRFNYVGDILGIPENRFSYIGINNPPGNKLAGAIEGERKTLDNYTQDPWGRTTNEFHKARARQGQIQTQLKFYPPEIRNTLSYIRGLGNVVPREQPLRALFP